MFILLYATRPWSSPGMSLFIMAWNFSQLIAWFAAVYTFSPASMLVTNLLLVSISYALHWLIVFHE